MTAAKAPGGPFRRVHGGVFGGPETISCPSCHWVGGPNGAGAETDNAFLEGDGVRPTSGDARNPPALVGLGVVQALAREMTRDLQKQRADLVREAARAGDAREVRLTTKGVDFGVLRATPKGEVDASGIQRRRPGPGGEAVRLEGDARPPSPTSPPRRSRCTSGIQSDVLLASGSRDLVGSGKDPADPDGDGVRGRARPRPVRRDDRRTWRCSRCRSSSR